MKTGFWRWLRRFDVKLMGLYLMLLLIPVTGLGLYGHFYLQRALSQYAIQSRLDALDLHAQFIQSLLEQVENDVLYLSQKADTPTSLASVNMTQELDLFVAAYPLYNEIAWLDLDGNLLAGGLSPAMQPELDGPMLVDAYNLPVHRVLFEQEIAPAGSVMMVARLDESLLLFELNAVTFFQGVAAPSADVMRGIVSAPDISLTAVTLDATGGRVASGFDAHSGYGEVDDQMVLYSRTGPENDWVLLEQVPPDIIGADLSNYYTTFFILMIGAVVSVIGLALFSIARIIEPVYQLQDMVARVREGSPLPPLSASLPADEFGALMTAFERMASELAQKQETERALVERLITAQEEERKLIAYDLHDGLIQQLVGARLYLRKGDPTTASSSPAYDVLTEAIAEGRRIMQGLHPTVLDDLGLAAALEELMQSMSVNTEWQCDFEAGHLATEPNRVTCVTLYRIAQEALNNAVKHAEASCVSLKLSCVPGTLTLTVADNGKGFQQEGMMRSRGRGWGLKTMKERAVMLNGTFDIESRPGEGTCVTVQIPIGSDDCYE